MIGRVLVLGGGFAGLWSALGAARQREEMGLTPDDVEITLVNGDPWHAIRVRNYETDLGDARVALDTVLKPVDVQRVEGRVTAITPSERTVTVASGTANCALSYDRLIFALGSTLRRPPIPGLDRYAFDVDTYGGAMRLQEHLRTLPDRPAGQGRSTVLVVGAGLTGIEVAAELPERLAALSLAPFRVVLADHAPRIGSDLGCEAVPVIETALHDLGIETRTGVTITAVDEAGVTLSSGERIPTETVIWCAGMRANPLTDAFPVEPDAWGRLPVDSSLKVCGVPDVFAAGDSARLPLGGGHFSVMSCQHSRPMGRFAGHNAVRDLLGHPLLPLEIDWYVTVLDLGAWGALYTEGWDRRVVLAGPGAKTTKQTINRERIYPPLSGNRAEIMTAAVPTVQTPPATRH